MNLEAISTKARQSEAWVHGAVVAMLLVFWLISTCHLDRFPAIFEDESWILSPGYKLFTSGVYGSDLFTGFHGMEERYLQFMPLLPLMQGATVTVLGIGVFQARILPVMIGSLTLAMTFAIAKQLRGDGFALITLLLLLGWQWASLGFTNHHGTGIPLVDLVRLARYDVLVALFGLGAFWHFLRARKQRDLGHDFLCGIFVGLAGLAHVNGLFWGAGLLIALTFDQILFGVSAFIQRVFYVMAGMILVLLPWTLIVVTNIDQFVGQQLLNPQRFEVFELSFYWDNIRNEPFRYLQKLRDGSALTRLGTWLQIIAMPIAMIVLAHAAIRWQLRAALWLLATTVTVALAFALLLQPKSVYYLPSVVVLFCFSISWLISTLLQDRRLSVRLVAGVVLALAAAQGATAIIGMQARAAAIPPANEFLVEIRQSIPTGVRVLALPQYWFAAPEPGYRSFLLLFALSDPLRNRRAIPFTVAMEQIAPDVVLLDPGIAAVLGRERDIHYKVVQEQFWTYIQQHNAQLITTVNDNFGAPIQIYRLRQPR